MVGISVPAEVDGSLTIGEIASEPKAETAGGSTSSGFKPDVEAKLSVWTLLVGFERSVT